MSERRSAGSSRTTAGDAAPRSLSRLRAWRHDHELHGLAPHVDDAWADAFVVELRLRDVSGRAIGDALAEVESHCVESGEPAIEAFGDPVAYAASLGLRPETGASARPFSLARTLPWVVQGVGLLLVLMGASAWLDGRPLPLTTGLLVTGLVLLATLVVLWRAATRALRSVVERTRVAGVLALALLGVVIGLVAVLDEALVLVPAPAALLAGVAVLVIGTLAVGREMQRETPADDPVRDPLEADAELPPAWARTTARVRYLPALLAPVVAVGYIGGMLLAG